MRIVILTLGTRGDVQPYLALGLGLRSAGHAVTLATSADFEGMATGLGLGFFPFEFSVRKALEDPDCRAAFDSKRAAMRLLRKMSPRIPRLLDDAWAAAQGAELVLYHPKILNGLDIAEKLAVPAMVAFYLPALNPTRAFPAPFIPGPASWGGFLNKLSHGLFLRLLTAPYHRLTNRWRATVLGLPPRSFWSQGRERYGRSIPKLYGYSRHIVPRPADWDDSAHVTGQWFLDDTGGWEPPRHLAAFLAAGAPPVSVSFGSILGRDPAASTRLVVAALRQCGQRGVILGGWGGLCETGLADDHCFLEGAPYDRLFPRMAAVVHHGGAGSTAEGLRAGKPTVVCPFFGDQPYWGKRVHQLGAGPEPIPQRRLTESGLARAIHAAVTDTGMIQRAASLGEKIRSEDGVKTAVRVIHELQESGGVSRPGPG